MKVKIEPTILYRTPKFPLNAKQEEHWEELKQSIAHSSKDFYELIKAVQSSDLHTLPRNIAFTIWKYFNRAKYRATPFGSFAGFGLFHQEQNNTEKIVIEDRQVFHEFIDWPFKDRIDKDSYNEKPDVVLIANSTFYISGNRLRYITSDPGGFELCEQPLDNLTQSILILTVRHLGYNQVIKVMLQKGYALEELENKIVDMVSLQLLFTESEPNIIGQDYFERLNIGLSEDTAKYIITEHPYRSGALNPMLLKHLPSVVKLLQQTAQELSDNPLVIFKQSFLRKFEQREVPLMIALDPEMGVGYNSLEHSLVADEFVMQFAGRIKEASKESKLKAFLKKHLVASNDHFPAVIHIDELDLEINDDAKPLSNTLNAIITVSDDLIHLEHLGGSTSSTLLGRFTLANKELHAHCKDMAQLEGDANPDVIFFDIGYMAEGYVDNINRRLGIYSHQLSILNYDTSASPLTLSDLMLSVQGGELVIRSQRLNKRMIPRLASAYNYSRSNLTIFRFLCDLQYQGIQTSPLLSMNQIIPGLPFYPRLQYRNVILSPAKWDIKKEEVLTHKKDINTITHCRQVLNNRGVYRYFKAGFGDQTLCFDMESDKDMDSFLQFISKFKSVLLSEALLPKQSVLTNTSGQGFHAEFILSLTHKHGIYKSVKGHSTIQRQNNSPVLFPPGKEWLYFEIYCHPHRADQILNEPIRNVLDQYRNQIRQWFFIRYYENGEHIRLRIRLINPEHGHRITSSLTDELEEDLNAGIISDIQIKTYKREIERYHDDLIEKVEAHFYHDSVYILELLDNLPEILQHYKICIKLIEAVEQSKLFSPAEFKQIISTVSLSFTKEHHLETKDYKPLNTRYQQFLIIKEDVNLKHSVLLALLKKSLVEVLQACGQEKRSRLFIDLMHMHINRMFNTHQRSHEMVIYYFALKNINRFEKMPEVV